MRLTDFGSNTYSQFNEDGIVDHIFTQIGTTSKLCVEFGAGDGLDCSNVAALWKNDWHAILLEADVDTYKKLYENINENCQATLTTVQPSGPSSIDAILNDQAHDLIPDFMSIDVDGNDAIIWQEMNLRPRVVCIEFNPTVPPHISLYQEYSQEKMCFGASLKALIEISEMKGYTFIGATQCNAFFVPNELAEPFMDLERDPVVLFPLENYTYLVTDFLGNAMGAGIEPPWGIHVPYVGPKIVGKTISFFAEEAEKTLDFYKKKYGIGLCWSPKWPNIASVLESQTYLENFLNMNISPVLVDITNVSNLDDVKWTETIAKNYGYQTREGGGVLAFVKI